MSLRQEVCGNWVHKVTWKEGFCAQNTWSNCNCTFAILNSHYCCDVVFTIWWCISISHFNKGHSSLITLQATDHRLKLLGISLRWIKWASYRTCQPPWTDEVTFELTGTALLPGSQYVNQPVGKHINIEMFGEEECLLYGGNDQILKSGRLELWKTAQGKKV